jgi:RimJ/RimL family protein N-acetyltransferase
MDDLEGYVSYYTGDRTGGVGGPKPRYVVVERFMAMVGQWALRGYGRYAMTKGGNAFGHVGVMHIDNVDPAEMTWTIWDSAETGRGYATEAAQAVMKAWTGAPLIARIAPDNRASIRMAERLGLTLDPAATPPSYNPDMITYRQVAA